MAASNEWLGQLDISATGFGALSHSFGRFDCQAHQLNLLAMDKAERGSVSERLRIQREENTDEGSEFEQQQSERTSAFMHQQQSEHVSSRLRVLKTSTQPKLVARQSTTDLAEERGQQAGDA